MLGLHALCRLLRYKEVDLLDHVVAPNVSAGARVPDIIMGVSGHGFLIASDSLTKHPSGPGIQPENTVSNLNHGRGMLKKNHIAPRYPFRHQLSRPSHFAL